MLSAVCLLRSASLLDKMKSKILLVALVLVLLKTTVRGDSVPSPPDDVSVQKTGETFFELRWNASLGAHIYHVFAEELVKVVSSSNITVKVNHTELSAHVGGLKRGMEYRMSVRTEDYHGNVSRPSEPIIDSTLAATPTELRAISVNMTFMTFKLEPAAGAQSYIVEMMPHDSNDPKRIRRRAFCDVINVQIDFLSPATRYFIVAKSVNAFGKVNEVASTPLEEQSVPGPSPSGYFLEVTTSSMIYRWPEVFGAVSYKIYASSNDFANSFTYNEHYHSTDNMVQVFGLMPGTKYSFQAQSIDYRERTSSLGELSYEQTIPVAPLNVSKTGVTVSSITLSWSKAKGAISYDIYVSSNDLDNNFTAKLQVNNTEFKTNRLDAGTWYNFTVYSKDAKDRLSPNGTFPITLQTTPLPPTGARVLNVTMDSVLLVWNEAKGATAYIVRMDTDEEMAGVEEIQIRVNDSITAEVNGLEASTGYKFSLRSIGFQEQVSPETEPVPFLTLPAAPEEPTLVNVTPNSILIEWTYVKAPPTTTTTKIPETTTVTEIPTQSPTLAPPTTTTTKIPETTTVTKIPTRSSTVESDMSSTTKYAYRSFISNPSTPKTECNFSDNSLNECCKHLVETEIDYSLPFGSCLKCGVSEQYLIRKAFILSKNFSDAQIKEKQSAGTKNWTCNTHLGSLLHYGPARNHSEKCLFSKLQIPRCIRTLLKSAYQSKFLSRGKAFMLKSDDVASIEILNDENESISASVEFSFDIANDKTFQDEVLPLYESEADGGRVLFTELSWKCVFMTEESFSDEGCQWKKGEVKTEVRCECDHTTAFSVLLAVETLTVPYHVKILSFVMESVSIFFLLITFFILMSVRKQLQNDRTFVQINLTFSLCLFHSANIAHEVALYVPELCFPVAVTLQYFLLTSIFWMLIEGVTLTIKTSDQALHYTNMTSLKRNILRVFTGWVIPGLITLAAAISSYFTDSYLAFSKVQQLGLESQSYQHDRCWMDPTSPTFIWSIVIPVCLVAFINLFILVRVACITIRLRRSVPAPSNPDPYDQEMQTMAEETRATLKLVLILLPVLGIPFLLGFFVGLGSPSFILASMYIHVVVNGLQGFFIFVVYCVIDGGVMRYVTKELSKTFSSFGGD